MPYLKLQTNVATEAPARKQLMQALSKSVAEQLGKPERYVMVAVETGAPMIFAGDDDPLAYLELKSIGLPESSTPALSETLASLIERELGIPGERIYIEFANAERHMWGWDKKTF